MMGDLHKSFIPSEDEIRQMLDRVVKENPSNYPTVVLQIEVARLMANYIGRLEEKVVESIQQLSSSIESK
jgi:hypothetical protein